MSVPLKTESSKEPSREPSKKDQTHLRILEAAGKLMREQGYAGAGLQKIMNSAGLTVGGFYAHFQSKERLFANVISDSFRQTRENIARAVGNTSGRAWVKGVISEYLSPNHRTDIAGGCPMPALLSEIPRAGAAARQVFEKEFKVSLERFRERLEEKNYQHAQVIMALMVGGISLARAVQDDGLADEILKSCREAALGFAKGNGVVNGG